MMLWQMAKPRLRSKGPPWDETYCNVGCNASGKEVDHDYRPPELIHQVGDRFEAFDTYAYRIPINNNLEGWNGS